MRWERGRATPDVIDQRGGGGRRRGAVAGGGLGLGGLLVVLLVSLLGGGGGGGGGLAGIDPGLLTGAAPSAGEPLPAGQDPERELRDFTAYVFTDAQERWEGAFERTGEPYRRAKLVLFRDAVSTGGCGDAPSSVGPFYCPADQRVYIDLSFYDDLARELRAPGDFAWAYVIAHEVGHHVQRQRGVSAEVDRIRREDPDRANEASVRQELQADCLAGVWARGVFEAGRLDGGDVEEAFTAAESVGDDRLQARAGGDVRPDLFTHGTSEQRRRWFDAGRRAGDAAACDTFSGDV